jgi:hypothetical protein
VAFLAKRWDRTESTVKNWTRGDHDIPAHVIRDVQEMVDDTESRLDALVDQLQPGDQLPTYRSETEYRTQLGEDAPYNCAWHRMLCARAASEVEDVTIVYAVEPANPFVRRVEASA